MDAKREDFDFGVANGDPRLYSPRSSFRGGRDEYEDVSGLRQNLRSAMRGARQKIAGLRVDLEEK